MRLYNYDYDDMKNFTMALNTNEGVQFLSSIYPTKLEVKVNEIENKPYLYYEGIVHTNKGIMKIIFPKLELVLDTVSYQKEQMFEERFRPWWDTMMPTIRDYKLITEFHNTDENIMFELKILDDEERKDMAKQLWNGVSIIGEDTNSED